MVAGLRLGQDLLSLGQGRRDAGDPFEAGIGQLVQILGAEGTVGHEIGGVGSGVSCANVVTDDLAKHFAIMTIATRAASAPGYPVLHDQLQHWLRSGR